MRRIETQPYDYELSDAEFFKLMGIEEPAEVGSSDVIIIDAYTSTTSKQQNKPMQSKTLLAIATTLTIVFVLLSSIYA